LLEKTLPHFVRSRSFEVFKEFIKTKFLHSAGALETDCTFIDHWSNLNLSTLYLFLLTFMIFCIELLLLI